MANQTNFKRTIYAFLTGIILVTLIVLVVISVLCKVGVVNLFNEWEKVFGVTEVVLALLHFCIGQWAYADDIGDEDSVIEEVHSDDTTTTGNS